MLSILNSSPLSSPLDAHIFGICDENRLVKVEFELTVNNTRLVLGSTLATELSRVLNLVRFQEALDDFFEVPGDQIWPRGRHNACLLHATHIEIIEASWREIHEPDLVLGKVLAVDLQLFGCRFILAHTIIEAVFTLTELRRQEQEVGLRGG